MEGGNLEQEAFQYFSGAGLNKKLHSLPPHAKEELKFGSILFHINLQSLHNLQLMEWAPVSLKKCLFY